MALGGKFLAFWSGRKTENIGWPSTSLKILWKKNLASKHPEELIYYFLFPEFPLLTQWLELGTVVSDNTRFKLLPLLNISVGKDD